MTATAPLSPLRQRQEGPNVGLILGIVAIVVLALASFGVIWFLGGAIGSPLLVALSGVMALVPLGFVIWAVVAIDRWEPEPRVAMWFSALWGGVAAVLLTLALNTFVLEPLVTPFLRSQDAYEFYATVIQAPITEELWKGIPVLIMFLFFRRTFDGPVDGVVFAALSAAGFAFTENILYFGTSLAESGDGSFIFFLRGIMSPLTHAIFTAVGIGLALGFAARLRSRSWVLLALPAGWLVSALLHALWNSASSWVLLALPAGWLVSALLHALWNSASSWVPGGTIGFFVYYLVVQVPLCVLAAVAVWLLLRQEIRLTRLRLDDYGRAGWFTREEVDLLASADGRAALTAWARHRSLRRPMHAYIQTATRLANHRQRALIGRGDRDRHAADETSLLADLMHHRRRMAAAVVGQPVPIPQGSTVPAHAGGRVQRLGDLDPRWSPGR